MLLWHYINNNTEVRNAGKDNGSDFSRGFAHTAITFLCSGMDTKTS